MTRFPASPPSTADSKNDASDPRAPSLARLCQRFDAALVSAGSAADPAHCSGFVQCARTALALAAAEPVLLTPDQRQGAPDRYRRHLLAADRGGRYAIVALVWEPGQASPVHGHLTWCGYTVLDGTLTETIYDWEPTQARAIAAHTRRREPGDVPVVQAGHAGIHRLGNASSQRAISLHVYGVPFERVATHVNDIVST